MCNERNIGKDDVMLMWTSKWMRKRDCFGPFHKGWWSFEVQVDQKILQESVKGSNRLWGRTIYIIQVVPQRILQVCQGSEIERQVLWPNSSYQQHKEQPTISSSRFRESGKDILSSPWLSYRPANSAPLISKFLEQEKPAITESKVRQEVWTSPKNKVAWSMDEIIS